jgi:hypothetical protein
MPALKPQVDISKTLTSAPKGMVKLEWKRTKGVRGARRPGMFQAIKGNYRAEVRQNYGIKTWRARLYLHGKLLADFPATSAEVGKEKLAGMFKQITLWDEM